MSELTTTARPYAKAVFEMARDSDTLEQWSKQLAAMSAVLEADGAKDLLEHPRMGRPQKAEAFAAVIGDELHDSGRNLLNTLAENDRLILLPTIASIYEVLKAEAEGAIEAEVISAQEMNDEQQKKIADALQRRLGREVKLVTSIDPSLMGGAVVRAGDLVIDGSIRSRLQAMQTSMNR